MSQSALSRVGFAFAAVMLAACGGGGGDSGTNPPPTPGFSVTLSSTTLSIEQGAAGSVTATIARTGSFTGTVNLSVEGVPSGLTAAFNPAAITSGTTSTTLNVSVASSVAPGSYSFTIRGQAAEVSEQKTATVSLTVTAKPAIAIALSPTSGSAQQGANLSYTATLTRTNFSAAVTVAATGAPAGVTATVSNTGDTYTVALAIGAAVAPGTYTITTTASGTGVTSVSADYSLTVTAATPTITLSAAPTTVTVEAGGASQSSTLTIGRIAFTGTVVLAVQSGLPTGATATFNPSGPTSATSATVTFAANASTTPGTYNVVIQGGGNGATPGNATIALTVSPQPSSITVSAAPTSLSIQQGAAGNTTINIARTNFPGAVTLAATNLPTGVTASFNTSPTTANSSTLTFTAGSGAQTGTFQVTVTGSGTGVSNSAVAVSLTVTPQSSGSSVSYQFCSPNPVPIWFAVQSGSGPWTPVTVGANNTFTANISGNGGVAYVTQEGTGYALFIIYGAATELGSGACTSQVTRSVTGTVSGLGATEFGFVNFGGGNASPTFANPNFTINSALPGARDLLATRTAFLPSIQLNKIFLKRGLNPPNGGSVGTVDFNGTDAFDPDTKTLTINGLAGGEQVGGAVSFSTNAASTISLSNIQLSSGNSTNMFVVPSAKTIAGDVHGISASATNVSGGIGTSRSIIEFLRDPGNLSVTLGPDLSSTTVSTVATAPYARLRMQYAVQPEYSNSWVSTFFQTTAERSAVIAILPGFLGSATNVDVTIPDFTGVGTWQATWGLQTGAMTAWQSSASGWIAGSGGTADGTIIRTAVRLGQTTP